MKKLRYKTKKEPNIGLDDLPQDFTPTHAYEYQFKKGKLKPHKVKLKNSQIKKLRDEREES